MKTWQWIGAGSFCLAASAFGQDSPRPPADPKPAAKAAAAGAGDAAAKDAASTPPPPAMTATPALRGAASEGMGVGMKADASDANYRPNLKQEFLLKGPGNTADLRFTIMKPARMDGRNADFFIRVYGFDFVEADPVLRSQLNIPAGEGLVVTRVNPGGMADQAGIKDKDVIAKINLQPVADVARAKAIIAGEENRSIYFDLYRAGEPVHLTLVKPERTPAQVPYWIGVPVATVDATLRSHLPMLPAGIGLIVTDVVADSPAARGGLLRNDILVDLDGVRLGSNETLVDQIQKSEGRETRVLFLRGGKFKTLAITPEKRAVVLANAAPDKPGDGNLGINSRLADMRNLAPFKLEGWGQAYRETPNRMVIIPNGAGVPHENDAIGGGPTLSPVTPANAQASARIEKELADLAGQVDALLKAMAELKKANPAAAEAKPAR